MIAKRILGKLISLLIVIFSVSCTQSSKQSEKKEIDINRVKSLADSCYERNDFEKSLSYLNQVLSRDTVNGEYYYKRGYSQAQLANFPESSKDYFKAAQLGFRKADAYYNLGLNQIVLLNDSLAVFYFNKALELNPNAPEIPSALEACKKRLGGTDKKKSAEI